MAAYQRQSQGFSLVELMISLAIGLIVVSAVLAFTLSSLTANSEYVQSTRLSQELRNSMDFISRELRRAGYDENMNRYTAASTMNALTISPFARIFVDDDVNNDGVKNDGCVIYAYDRTGGTPGAVERAQGEIRALRLAFYPFDGQTVGVLEIGESALGLTPTCAATSCCLSFKARLTSRIKAPSHFFAANSASSVCVVMVFLLLSHVLPIEVGMPSHGRM